MGLTRHLILISRLTRKNFCVLALAAGSLLTFCSKAHAEGENRPPMRMLTEKIEASPKNPDLYLKRAELHTKYLNLESAVADASNSINLKPSEKAYMLRGAANMGLGRLDRAEADYEKAAQLAPDSQNAQAELACMAAKLHHFEKAQKAFAALFKINPGRTVELSRRAEMFIAMGKYAEALRDCQQTLKTDKDKGGRVHEIMGRAHFLLGQYQKAADAYSYTISKNQFSVDARRARAEAYDKLGKTELAKRDRKELDEGFSEAFSNAPFRSK
jgi:tetratricopeptide (TPR) repeat protein